MDTAFSVVAIGLMAMSICGCWPIAPKFRLTVALLSAGSLCLFGLILGLPTQVNHSISILIGFASGLSLAKREPC